MAESPRDAVRETFRILLNREPESDEVIEYYCNHLKSGGSILRVFQLVSRSKEYQTRLRTGPLWNYSSTFNIDSVLEKYEDKNRKSHSSTITNFIGLQIKPEYMPAILASMISNVEPIPSPGNWHADIAEWGAALRAVDLTRSDTFTVAELGCGWGCWMANTGHAARSRGLRPVMLGVEGDPGHIAFARDCLSINGLESETVELHHGVATAGSGTALFPRQSEAGGFWDLAPIFDASVEQVTSAGATGEFDTLDQVSLADVIGERRLDLLHIDIQGGEADLIEATLPLLANRVGYIVIGTHSREIEGRLHKVLGADPWLLEVERPAVVRLTPKGPITEIDGVQGWRNHKLIPLTGVEGA